MKLRRNRFWIKLNTGAALLLAAAIFLMVNYVASRHYSRVDLSKSQFYSLSPKTESLLESLDSPIDVTVFFQPGNVLYEDIYNLMREYQLKSDQISVQWVDPDRDIAQTEALAVKYEVTEPNVVVFDYHGRNKYVRADEIARTDASSGIEKILSFRGEQAFSSAILGIVQKDIPVVYFLTGHGECDIDNFDAGAGFSKLSQLIERDNTEVRKLELSSEKKIPADCSVLIAAGATQSMSTPEADLINSWLKRSGRLLVMSDALRNSGLEPVLREWGVRLQNDLVIDPARTMTGREVFVSGYNPHAITSKLSTTAARFISPRSVQIDKSSEGQTAADRPQVTMLAMSSTESWSEVHPNQSPAKMDKDSGDTAGPCSMAVAIEKGSTQGRLDVQLRPSRAVVFGDSGFVSNGALTGGDISLFMSSLNWLLDREELMAIASKEVDDTRLQLDRKDVGTLFWLIVLGIPAFIAIPGCILWFSRRK